MERRKEVRGTDRTFVEKTTGFGLELHGVDQYHTVSTYYLMTKWRGGARVAGCTAESKAIETFD